jgi:poly(3-hydroxybutyrate) depolymerase
MLSCLVVLHGATGTPEAVRATAGWERVLPRNWRVISPGALPENKRVWDTGVNSPDVRRVMADIRAAGCTRVVATGHSQGGIISSVLGCRMPEVTTVVAVGGYVPVPNCRRKFGLVVVHGWNDTVVWWNGGWNAGVGTITPRYYWSPISRLQLAAAQAARNGCGPRRAPMRGLTRWSCPSGLPVVVLGHRQGHDFPWIVAPVVASLGVFDPVQTSKERSIRS